MKMKCRIGGENEACRGGAYGVIINVAHSTLEVIKWRGEHTAGLSRKIEKMSCIYGEPSPNSNTIT